MEEWVFGTTLGDLKLRDYHGDPFPAFPTKKNQGEKAETLWIRNPTQRVLGGFGFWVYKGF